MPESSPWFVYVLECANGRLYTGITVDLERRFRQHRHGKGAMYTRLNKPYRMLGAKACIDRSEASRLEAHIKKLPAAHKRNLADLWRQTHTLPASVSYDEIVTDGPEPSIARITP
ncbi:MAG TPA: GIY-YIG nuclease family protein [Acidiferrobacter sp.]|nr:GIY-YIG nuclease family protein [Acidiferrobacter sp.]